MQLRLQTHPYVARISRRQNTGHIPGKKNSG